MIYYSSESVGKIKRTNEIHKNDIYYCIKKIFNLFVKHEMNMYTICIYDFIFKKSKYNHIRKSYMAQIDKKHPHANIDISAIYEISFYHNTPSVTSCMYHTKYNIIFWCTCCW